MNEDHTPTQNMCELPNKHSDVTNTVLFIAIVLDVGLRLAQMLWGR